MISWSYYGERAWEYLFGATTTIIYRIIFVCFVFLGSVTTLSNVLDFSDMMILGMAFPNIIGGIILSPQVKAALNDYWTRLKSGQMKTYS
jgi:AGCS family alanine or glycine:cation symporter